MKNKVQETTESLRDILFEEIRTLRSGDSSTDRANSVSKLASQIIYATRLELENKRMEVAIGDMFGQVRWDNIDGEKVSIPVIEV